MLIAMSEEPDVWLTLLNLRRHGAVFEVSSGTCQPKLLMTYMDPLVWQLTLMMLQPFML